MTTAASDETSLKDEIAHLERRLNDAKAQLRAPSATPPLPTAPPAQDAQPVPALHALLLLSDSALPLGSFAFSSGLESYLAHHKPSPPSASQLPSFHAFLRLSLATLASTALPYVLAAYRNPAEIETLDNDFDASTPCTVARRASIAQGRALLTVWERSFRAQYEGSSSTTPMINPSAESHSDPAARLESNCSSAASSSSSTAAATQALTTLSHQLRTTTSSSAPNAHLAPLWGLTTLALSLSLRDAAYLFLFSHARTVISAAVRASVMGPYQAQAVLASSDLQARIWELVDEGWGKGVEDAGQSVPVMDLWVGRHERLYSRIFNS